MPKFLALQDAELPVGVVGSRTVGAGSILTVSDDEATLLAEHPAQFRALDGWRAIKRTVVDAAATVTKAEATSDSECGCEEG